MKIKIIRSRLLEGLKTVQNVVNAKGTLPVLQNVLIQASDKSINMTTTDLDLSIQTSVECEVVEGGSTTLPVKLLFNLIAKASEGEITIEVDAQERATITGGSAKYKLACIPESQFPKLAKEDESYAYEIEEAVLREMLRKVSYATSQDDTRRALKGVLMKFSDQKLTMVATDGRRLALVEKELEFSQSEEKEIILPAKTVQELQHTLTGDGKVKVMFQNKQITLQFGMTTLYSKLIEEKYPNYQQVIPPKSEKEIAVDRQLLIDALERASVMTMDEAHSTKLIFSEGKLTVTSAANDVGEARDEVPIKYADETIEIVFNPAYVLDCLRTIDDDEITIHLTSGSKPAVIRCGVPFICVLMPLRIN